jgi:hypothetical protein
MVNEVDLLGAQNLTATGASLRIGLQLLPLAPGLVAQERKIDPTWLHRYLPEIKAWSSPLTTETCSNSAEILRARKTNDG